MRRSKRSLCLCVLCLFVSMLIVGCGTGFSAEDAKELNMGLGASPPTIDPQQVSDTGSSDVVVYYTATLYEYNKDRELVPGLAESCEVSGDGLTVTYHIRDGLKWSDGSDLDAEDFVFGFQRIADPDTKSGSVYLITDCCSIVNAQEVNSGDLPVSELGVSAPDRLTFVIRLEQPCPYLNSLVTLCAFSPCSRNFFNDCGSSYATSADTVLSCGPYILDRYEPLATQIHLSKNPYYYKADEISLPGVNLRVAADAQQGMMCYESGLLDIIRIGGELAEIAAGDPELIKFSIAQIYRLDINHSTNKFLSNRNIRLAISKSIDRQSITDNVFRVGYSPMTRAVPSNFCTNADGTDFAGDISVYDEYNKYDPDKAAEYWAEGLKEVGEENPHLELVCLSSMTNICEVIKQQLEKNLSGLSIEIIPVPVKDWLVRMNSGTQYDLILASWVADYADPTSMFTSCNYIEGSNIYNSAEFDELLDKSQQAEGAERDELLHKAEEHLMRDVALIPLFGGEAVYLQHTGVTGMQVIPTGAEPIITGLKKEAE